MKLFVVISWLLTASGPVAAAEAQLSGTSKQIWIATVQAVSQHATIKILDRETGLVITDLSSIPGDFNSKELRQYVNAPTGALGFLSTWNGLKVQITVNVVEIDTGRSNISVDARYIGYEDNLAHKWVDLRSNGKLETSIVDEVKSRLSAPAIVK